MDKFVDGFLEGLLHEINGDNQLSNEEKQSYFEDTAENELEKKGYTKKDYENLMLEKINIYYGN